MVSLLLQWITWSCLLQYTFSAPMQLVTKDGFCRNSNQISKYISSREIPDSKVSSVVNIVDCSGADSYSLVNEILGSDLTTRGGPGVTLGCSATGLVIYSSFDCMVSSKFCGCNAIDYCNSLPGSTCLVFKAADIINSLVGYDQIFRRVLKFAKQNPNYEVTILLDVDEDSENASDLILSHAKAIWQEMEDTDFDAAVSFRFITVNMNSDDPDELASAKAAICSKAQVTTLDAAFVNRLVESWDSVKPTGEPRLLLSPSQRESVYRIEEAYASGLAHANVAIAQWQQRVSSGNLVGKFAKRVGELILSVKEEYNDKTAPSSMSESSPVRERIERLQLLRNHIDIAVITLYRQQLTTLELKVTNGFRKELLQMVASSSIDTEEELETDQDDMQLLRKSLFDFKSMAADLESDPSMPSSLSATLEDETTKKLSELSATLEATMKDFPETAAAKLQEMKNIDRLAKQSRPRQPKKWGMPKINNFVLNIVGMLRPPGFGNLQGFVGYATQLAGLPLELLLGVQNDGDSPEIMGEDREYPILRLQPKVNFDIDL